jgi:tetratricopeptide (TPR) repeat protein
MAAERAERILLRMIEVDAKLGTDRVLVNKQTVDTVLHLWSKSPKDDRAERAESLLRDLEAINRESPHHEVQVRRSSFRCVMKCWGRSSSHCAPERAEALLFELEERFNGGDRLMRPTVLHYSAAISAWTHCSRKDGLDRAEKVFDKAVAAYQSGNKAARPDSFVYGELLLAYSRLRQPEQAERCLRQMLDDFDRGNKGLKPSPKEFNCVLLGWMLGKSSDAPNRVRSIFQLMKDRRIRPERRTFELMIETLNQSYRGEPAIASEIRQLQKAMKGSGRVSAR